MEMCFPRLKKKTKIKKMLMRTIEYRRLKHVSKTICLTEDSTSLHPSIFRFFSEDPLVSRLCRSVNTTRNALYAHTHSLKILSLPRRENANNYRNTVHMQLYSGWWNS